MWLFGCMETPPGETHEPEMQIKQEKVKKMVLRIRSLSPKYGIYKHDYKRILLFAAGILILLDT